MKALVIGLGFWVGLSLPARSVAQEAPPVAEPTREHQWLHQFVGEWEVESELNTGPDQPAMTSKGTIRARKLGEFWVISEMNADIMGTHITALQTLGYDAKTKKFIGTWVDSILDLMWKYEGTVDPDQKTLTMEAEGPNMMAEGKTTRFRDAYEFKSKDHIVMTSSMLGEDGKWVTFMTGNAVRKK